MSPARLVASLRLRLQTAVPPCFPELIKGAPAAVFTVGETSARQIKTWFDGKGKNR